MCNIATDEPIRLKQRKETEAPSWRKSTTASEEPIRAMPRTDSDELRRQHPLSDKEAPIVPLLSTEIEAPSRAKLRSERLDPI